jgi:alkylation response protein AidB-like acyl-CoA dehydrogenase
LWVFFSECSAAAVKGHSSFIHEMVFASAAWLPLSLAFAAGFMDFVRTPKRESFVPALEWRLTSKRRFVADAAALRADGVGSVIVAPLIRIVLMQVAVIFGAMLVRKYGTEAQKERWLRPLAQGELFGAGGVTEPRSGSS